MTQKRFCKWDPHSMRYGVDADEEDCDVFATECGYMLCPEFDEDTTKPGLQDYYCHRCGLQVRKLKFTPSRFDNYGGSDKNKYDDIIRKKLKSHKKCKWKEGYHGYDNISDCAESFECDEREWVKFCPKCSLPVEYIEYEDPK